MATPIEGQGPIDQSAEGTDFSGGIGGISPEAVTPKILPAVTPRVTRRVTPINQRVSPGHQGVVEQQP